MRSVVLPSSKTDKPVTPLPFSLLKHVERTADASGDRFE